MSVSLCSRDPSLKVSGMASSVSRSFADVRGLASSEPRFCWCCCRTRFDLMMNRTASTCTVLMQKLSLSPGRRVQWRREWTGGVNSVGPSPVEKMGARICFFFLPVTHVWRQRRQRNTVRPPFLPASVVFLRHLLLPWTMGGLVIGYHLARVRCQLVPAGTPVAIKRHKVYLLDHVSLGLLVSTCVLCKSQMRRLLTPNPSRL
jgi:hypothetical protein